MLKISENNGKEKIGLVTPTPNIHPKLMLNQNLAQTSPPITSVLEGQSFWNFAQSTAVRLSRSLQNYNTIR